MTRLTSEIWVSAYLTRCQLATIPAFVVQKGDANQAAKILDVAIASALVQAVDKRRTIHGSKNRVIAADLDVVGRVAGQLSELAWTGFGQFARQAPWQVDHVATNVSARRFPALKRAGMVRPTQPNLLHQPFGLI